MTSTPPSPSPRAPSACEGLVSGLLVRCARGETAALGTLFDLTYGLVAATLGRRAAEETDDLVVEVFQDVWRHAPAFRPGLQDPLAWLLGIADATVAPRHSLVAS
jgi:DNA-directed RNA polymerase specialized sigma24 family protein